MFRHFLFAAAVAMAAGSAFAQAPDVLWSRTFGGADYEEGYWIEETSDSGYIAVGRTGPYGGPFDCYVVRLAPDGSTRWTTAQGGDERDEAMGVCPTADGGFLVGGFTWASPTNGYDLHLFKLTAGGDEEWDHQYGEASVAEYMTAMCQTADGDYVLVGTDSDSDNDLFLVKVNSSGGEIWTRRVDLPGSAEPKGIAPTSDGGFIIAGNPGVQLVRFSSAGNTVWRRAYGSGTTVGRSVVQLADGGFAAVGFRDFGATDDDVWFLRLDENGDTLFTRHYGNDDPDQGYCIRSTHDGGFIMAGHHYPPGENRNFYVIRTDSNGDTLWTKSVGGDGSEYAFCIQPTADTGYIIVGRTNSFGGGANDMYIVRLGPDRAAAAGIGDDELTRPRDFALGQNYPNPFNAGTRIDYVLQSPGHVRIAIYNLLGQPVRSLCDEVRSAGRGSVRWDGSDQSGSPVASGIYFYRLRLENEVTTRRMLLLK